MPRSYPGKSWTDFTAPENAHFCSASALEVIDGLLRFDHKTRLTAAEVLELGYFGKFRLV